MKANAVSDYLKNKEFLKTAGVSLGWLGLMAAVCLFLIMPQNKKIHVLKDKQAMLEVKSRQYSNFKEFGEKLKTEREHIAAVVQSVSADQILTEKNDQSVFAAIGRICEKADIKLDKITQSKASDKGQEWELNFKAPYAKMAVFVSLLEQSFKIDTFKITSGRNAAIHEVAMLVYPVTVPEAVAAPAAGKDLFDLYNDVDAALTKLESKLNTDKSSDTAARDPMLLSDAQEKKEPEKKAVAPKEKTATAAPAPACTVEDIFWDPETPLVAIDGKVCREGETFRDFQVVKIREKNVDIKWHSRVYTLAPGNNKEVK